LSISYVREKHSRRLQEAEEQIQSYEAEISRLTKQSEDIRDAIAEIDKEINEGGARVASLRENLRVRKLIQDIDETDREVKSYDIESAAKAQRQFDEKYNAEKKKEMDMQNKVGVSCSCALLGSRIRRLPTSEES
jgi:DNA repair protein RAD50